MWSLLLKLPSDECGTTTRNARQSPACSPPNANASEKLRGYRIKVHQILSGVEGSSAVLMRASMLRSSHPLWNASTQNEGGYANFRRFTPKSVTIATSLERSRKEDRMD